MTGRFILDENVVIFAQRGENELGEQDETCMRLFQQIVQICHTIVLDPYLWGTYHSQLSAPRHSHPDAGSRVLRLLRSAVQMFDKVDVRPSNAPSFPEESAIPAGSQDDVKIVRLAVETGATLVTTDRPLRASLRSSSIVETYGLRVASPSEALELL